MPKPSTYPTLYQDLNSLSIADLRRMNILHRYSRETGVIQWSSGGGISYAIHIGTSTHEDPEPGGDYLALAYIQREVEHRYRIQIVSRPSNLGPGRGVVYYFICPVTDKLTKKLYSIDGYFCHRSLLEKGMYKSQVESHRYRRMGKLFDIDDLYNEIYSKHFKQFYNGKPTRKYARLVRKIENINQLSARGLLRW